MVAQHQVSNDGNSVQDNVNATFDLDNESDTGQDYSDDTGEPGLEGDDTGSDTGSDETGDDTLGLPDFEKFLRDSERPVPGKGKQQQQPNKGQQQQNRQQQQAKPDRYQQDQKGNIIDPRTGSVLAKAGAEARLYMDGRAARMEAYQQGLKVNELTGHLRSAVGFIDQFRAQIQGYKDASQAASRAGVTPEEQAQAIGFIARLKRGGADGIGAIKEILTRAASAGMDLTPLGVGAGGFDVKALVDQIRGEFAPIRQTLEADRNAREQAIQRDNANKEAWNRAAQHTVDFFSQNRDAVPYAQVIEKALNDPRYRGWSIREVWLTIQNHLIRNGSNGSTHREIPRGRQQVQPGNRNDPTRVAHPNTTYEDLVNELLDEAGIT